MLSFILHRDHELPNILYSSILYLVLPKPPSNFFYYHFVNQATVKLLLEKEKRYKGGHIIRIPHISWKCRGMQCSKKRFKIQNYWDRQSSNWTVCKYIEVGY